MDTVWPGASAVSYYATIGENPPPSPVRISLLSEYDGLPAALQENDNNTEHNQSLVRRRQSLEELKKEVAKLKHAVSALTAKAQHSERDMEVEGSANIVPAVPVPAVPIPTVPVPTVPTITTENAGLFYRLRPRIGTGQRFHGPDWSDGPTERHMWSTAHLEYVRVDRNHMLDTPLLLHERTLRSTGTVMIGITMYNEDWDELSGTLSACMRNFDPWVEEFGPEVRQRVVLVVMADGREKMNPKTREQLQANGFITNELDEPSDKATLHCFSCWAQYASGVKPFGWCNVLVLIKEQNGGKLDTHKVFMDGLAVRLQPELLFTLDCGTFPHEGSLVKIYEEFINTPDLGACAGEIEAQTNWCNAVVTAQVFEYKIAHTLQKPLESVLGYVTVLPGAFSAYRWKALATQDDKTGLTPLDKYFEGLNKEELGPFESNIYLAEDRVLCFELIARNGIIYKQSYIPGATATCDVPQDVIGLLKQRKRWLNGSLFSLAYSYKNAGQLYAGSVSAWTKATFTFEMCLLAISSWLALLGPANYYIIIFIVIVQPLILGSGYAQGDDTWKNIIGVILSWILYFVLCVQLIFGLGNSQPDSVRGWYVGSTLFYNLLQVVLLVLGIYFLITSDEIWLIILSVLGFAIFPLATLIHEPRDLPKVCGSMLYFLVMSPLFIVILPFRAIANIHDVSWGTKGLEDSAKSKGPIFQRFRSNFMLAWVMANLTLGLGIIFASEFDPLVGEIYLAFLSGLIVLLNGTRTLLLAFLRIGRWSAKHCCKGKRKTALDPTVYPEEKTSEDQEAGKSNGMEQHSSLLSDNVAARNEVVSNSNVNTDNAVSFLV